MVRVTVSIAVLVVLTAAYVVEPVAGWGALGSTFAILAARRLKKTPLREADLERASSSTA
jgi:hypothetical protein